MVITDHAKILFLLFLLANAGLLLAQHRSTVESPNRKLDFDYGWKFFRGDDSQAQQPDFNDSKWRTVDVPHDWSIEDLPNQKENETVGPFSITSVGKSSTGHTVGGIGWYRKKFKLNSSGEKRIVKIHFDGVYMISDVWINGHHLGTHPNGYTAFHYDLSKYLNPSGKENIIAVKVSNEGKNSRWYTGSGIYRHVWLTQTNSIYIEPWGISVIARDVSTTSSTLAVTAAVKNEGSDDAIALLKLKISDPNGTTVSETSFKKNLKANEVTHTLTEVKVSAPQRWSLTSPTLYRATVEILLNGAATDKSFADFGIRTLEFSASKGFLLNGERILLKGACLHHDNGPLGSKAIDRAEERKVELMKANGFNAIRCSHNPPSEVFLNACDRLGMLVIDEAFDMWQLPKNPEDYHRFFDTHWKSDLQSLILRDRNHPSVIMWSIGNEIKERADSSGLAITKQLADETRRLDPTRPVIAAICKFWEQPGKTWDESATAFRLLDVGGYNYEWRNYESDHKKYPDRIITGTESIAMEAFENWEQVKKNSYVIGDFIWTGMDYLGEAGIGHAVLDNEKDSPLMEWPWFNGYCGDLDLCGFKKPQSFYRDVIWGRRNISMAVHMPIPEGRTEKVSFWGWPNELQSWTWPGSEGNMLEVTVYTSYPTVRLELNGKVIETKTLTDTSKLKVKFSLPYSPGTLTAVGVDGGKDVGFVSLSTAGRPAALKLSVDRDKIQAHKNDLAYVVVELVDDNGVVIPNRDVRVYFKIGGVGKLAGVANGHPSELKSFQQPFCKTFRGRCMAIVQPDEKGGSISLLAEVSGLPPATIHLQSVK
jgi:beta-galactosidase